VTNRFFITGQPRSRTAWFARFFTTNDTSCMHDGIQYSDYGDRLADESRQYVGDSSSAIPMCTDRLMSMYPCSPIVLIERDLQRAYEFEHELGMGKWVDTAQSYIELLKTNYRPLVVQYNDINERLEEIWNHCCPQAEYPGNGLIHENITCSEEYIKCLSSRH